MSLNDPQWGKREGNSDSRGSDDDKRSEHGNSDPRSRQPNSQQEPPDLEQLWNDFNRRLGDAFGKPGRRGQNSGGGQGGGNGPRPGNNGGFERFKPRLLGGGLSLIAAVVASAWLASGFYIVDASQRGVVLQFGSYHETTEPGLRWHFPAPFQSHEIVNLSGVRTVEIGYRGQEKNKVLREALMLTDDENIINIQFAVQYVLHDVQDYLFSNRHPDDTVVQAAETAMREVVGRSKMDFVLYEGREQVAVSAQKIMQGILDRYKTGIQVSKVTMQNAQPPEQVQDAFDDAVKAGQDRERQKNEGQAYANDVIPRAQGTASRLLEEAEGYKSRVVAQAEGDSNRFKQILVEYSKAPEVTRQRMYLDTMQQIFANTSKVMVDAKGQGNLLYLPLDKLMQAAGAGAAAAPSAVNPVAESPKTGSTQSTTTEATPPRNDALSGEPVRQRESLLRSRERGER